MFSTMNLTKQNLTHEELTITQQKDLLDRYNTTCIENALTIILCNGTGKTQLILGPTHNNRHSTYKIIPGAYREDLEDAVYDTYFYNTADELTQILDFITAHSEIYKYTQKDDIFDIFEETDIDAID